jgi:hypothetical protein
MFQHFFFDERGWVLNTRTPALDPLESDVFFIPPLNDIDLKSARLSGKFTSVIFLPNYERHTNQKSGGFNSR